MKTRVKERLKEANLPINAPNRRQGRTHNLCVCGQPKKEHFKNALGCNFKAGTHKNNLSVGA